MIDQRRYADFVNANLESKIHFKHGDGLSDGVDCFAAYHAKLYLLPLLQAEHLTVDVPSEWHLYNGILVTQHSDWFTLMFTPCTVCEDDLFEMLAAAEGDGSGYGFDYYNTRMLAMGITRKGTLLIVDRDECLDGDTRTLEYAL